MLGNYLITEDTTMKAFKKLMAAALVCVMALTMLTGCGVADKSSEKKMVEALTSAAKTANSGYTYEKNDALQKMAESASSKAADKKITDGKGLEVAGYLVIEKKLPNKWFNSESDLKTVATEVNKTVSAAGPKKTDKNVVNVGVDVKKVGDDNYAFIVVELAK